MVTLEKRCWFDATGFICARAGRKKRETYQLKYPRGSARRAAHSVSPVKGRPAERGEKAAT